MDIELKIGDEVYLSSLNEKCARVVLDTYATSTKQKVSVKDDFR